MGESRPWQRLAAAQLDPDASVGRRPPDTSTAGRKLADGREARWTPDPRGAAGIASRDRAGAGDVGLGERAVEFWIPLERLIGPHG
jgi:hypothetical protein